MACRKSILSVVAVEWPAMGRSIAFACRYLSLNTHDGGLLHYDVKLCALIVLQRKSSAVQRL